MKERAKIQYGDIAPGAKENFVPSTNDKAEFIDISQLQRGNLSFENYVTPCEYGTVPLDSTAVPFPANPENNVFGYWSNQISGENGTFATPIVLTFMSAGSYKSKGITLTFDTYNGIFCNNLTLKWYANESLIAESDFTPDKAEYFCEKEVAGYNKVEITFISLNMPYNRLKLRAIEYGQGITFYSDSIESISLIQEVNPISDGISVNTADFTILASETDYSFEANQPFTIYYNGELKAKTFLETSKPQSDKRWSITTHDYVGLMEKIVFIGEFYGIEEGGIEITAYDLLTEILTVANVPYEIDDRLKNILIHGVLGITKCREALRQVCFASGAVCDTANTDVLKVYLPSDLSSQRLSKYRVARDQSIDTTSRVTKVTLEYQDYFVDSMNSDRTVLYSAAESGTGENIKIYFDNPVYADSITIIDDEGDNWDECIHVRATNYAVFDMPHKPLKLVAWELSSRTKEISKQIDNLLINDTRNEVSISGGTLVGSSNASEVLDRCFNYLEKNNSAAIKILESQHVIRFGNVRYGEVNYSQFLNDKPVNAGDVIEFPTEYKGNITGKIISERFNLNGNIILKECDVIW